MFWIIEIITNDSGLFADRDKNIMAPFNRNISKISNEQLNVLDPFRGKWTEGLDLTCEVS